LPRIERLRIPPFPPHRPLDHGARGRRRGGMHRNPKVRARTGQSALTLHPISHSDVVPPSFSMHPPPPGAGTPRKDELMKLAVFGANGPTGSGRQRARRHQECVQHERPRRQGLRGAPVAKSMKRARPLAQTVDLRQRLGHCASSCSRDWSAHPHERIRRNEAAHGVRQTAC
jgi:hypothetical protein